MNKNKTIQSFHDEVNKLRTKLSRLEINKVEENAANEVHKWRQSFGSSSSVQVDRILNDLEKGKQEEVTRLASELRMTFEQFKEANMDRLAELDVFISKMNTDQDTQINYVKFELNAIKNKIECLDIRIIVEVIDGSQRRRSSTALARNTLQLKKVFDFTRPRSETVSSSTFLDNFKDFFRSSASSGARYYNAGLLGQSKIIPEENNS